MRGEVFGGQDRVDLLFGGVGGECFFEFGAVFFAQGDEVVDDVRGEEEHGLGAVALLVVVLQAALLGRVDDLCRGERGEVLGPLGFLQFPGDEGRHLAGPGGVLAQVLFDVEADGALPCLGRDEGPDRVPEGDGLGIAVRVTVEVRRGHGVEDVQVEKSCRGVHGCASFTGAAGVALIRAAGYGVPWAV